MNLEELRYPIGKFEVPETITDAQLSGWIDQLAALPEDFRRETAGLSEEQLNTPYRPEGWTLRQLVHHVSDSHHNSYIRFKWALTEDNPMIKAYDEKAWAELFDTREAPISLSLDHLSAVHAKLVLLLRGLSREMLDRTFRHPETGAMTTLAENVGRYVWHGSHHLAHLKGLKSRMGW